MREAGARPRASEGGDGNARAGAANVDRLLP